MNQNKHIVAIFGAGVAGSEAAYQLAQHGIASVVFEQHSLPYGKIEEGLPKWHTKLRNKEEQKIDQKLTQPDVHIVPETRLGQDINLEEVMNLGFSAVLLAIGAWRDRPLPVPGIDEYIGKGFYYQNPFVAWFNHNHEPDTQLPGFDVQDGAIVIGGGLASMDVLKILMIETTRRALVRMGEDIDIFTIEKKGVSGVLKKLNLTLSDLGLKGCTLFYRKRVVDMPLAPMPENVSPARLEKVYEVRKRILKNFKDQYLFKVEENFLPVEKIIENGRLTGLIFQKTAVENGEYKLIPNSEKQVVSPLTISSVGSVPEPLPEIPISGELYAIKDHFTGQLEQYENLFALGNAVTGRGNIKESQVHGKKVSKRIIENYFNSDREIHEIEINNRERELRHRMQKISNQLVNKPPLSRETTQKILQKVKELQHKSGYDGNYEKWISQHLPVRLEDIIEEEKLSA